MRRYTVGTLLFTTALIGLVLLLDLVGSQRQPGVCTALGVAAVGVLVEYVRITAACMPGLLRSTLARWEIPVAVAVAVGVWWVAVATSPLSIGWVLPASLVEAAVVPMLRGWWRWAVALGGGVPVAASGVLFADAAVDWPVWVVFAATMTPIAALSNFLQVWLWSLVRQLDEARQVAAELAVAEERLRFAAELHDIQGHHLQAIALKGELAARLVGHDDEAARTQATEVSELARTALRETRAVVHGYRRSSLSTEINNAVDILRAAGINATVRGSATEVPPPLQPLFGVLVREGTTNILRHSAAAECQLTVEVDNGRVRVELTNDGAGATDPNPGSGLQGLKERFATVGGVVRARRDTNTFHLTGEAAVS